jgi:putative tricarboxylic transport membrane protein
MNRTDVVAGLLLAAGFAACLWDASSFQYGTEFAPGPGFAPVWLSAIGMGLSLAIALIAFRARRRREAPSSDHAEPIDKAGRLHVLATLLGLVTMVAIAPWLGLIPSILLFLLFLTLYVQRLSVVTGIAASAGTVLFVYIVFVHLLDVPIPSGPLRF